MFTSETMGIQLSADVIKITLDGGRTWKPVFPCAAKIQANGLWQNLTCEWRRLQFVTPSIAYAAAKSYDARTELFLAKTTDGGATWSMITQELTDYAEDAFFVDSNTGYVRVGYPAQPQLAARWFPGRHADASAGAGAAAVVPSSEEHQGSVVGGGNGDEYSRTGQRALTDGALGVPESKVRFWRSAGRGLP
jgi:photosystem II stability/assembly factor-like uncharacterized protein